MSERFRHIITLVPNDHEFVCNDYVLGRISAVLKIFCAPRGKINMGTLKRYSQPNEDYGYFFEVYTTDDAYKRASDYLEYLYPDVCFYDIPHDIDLCSFAEDEYDKGALCLGRYGG